MLRGPLLRATVNRKMTIDGEFRIHRDKQFIELPNFKVLDGEGKQRKVLKPGDQIAFISEATIRMVEHVAIVRPHPAFYENGLVYGNPMITPTDGTTKIVFTVGITDRMDITKLPYLCELYISE